MALTDAALSLLNDHRIELLAELRRRKQVYKADGARTVHAKRGKKGLELKIEPKDDRP